MQGFRCWNCKTHQPDKERKKKNLIPFLGQSVATVNRLKPKVNKDMLVSCGKKVTGSRLVQESCRHWCWQWHCVEPDAGQGCAGSVPHHPDLGSPCHSSKFPPFPRERRRMVHTLWGRSIIWQTAALRGHCWKCHHCHLKSSPPLSQRLLSLPLRGCTSRGQN